jgi:hypothetical protein
MNPRIKYNWLIIALIWAGVFYLANRNSQTILDILDNREKKEVLRLDKEFWQRNSNNIADVVKRQNSLYQEIESPRLGQVGVGDKLKRMFSASGLYEITLEMDAKQEGQDSATVHISCKGPIKAGLEAFGRITTELPFLSFQEVGILPGETGSDAAFDIVVNYRYKVVAESGQ